MTNEIALTPSEDLLIEVLIARHRLGEPFWVFDYAQRPVLKRLQAKGLVTTEPATTPHIEARLTPEGRERFMSRPWLPSTAKVQWAVKTPDDSKPIHYVIRSQSVAESEEYHRKYAARNGGDLYRRAIVEMPWELVPEVQS